MQIKTLKEAKKAVDEASKASNEAWKAVEATPAYKAYVESEKAYKETPEWKKWAKAENDKYRAVNVYNGVRRRFQWDGEYVIAGEICSFWGRGEPRWKKWT